MTVVTPPRTDAARRAYRNLTAALLEHGPTPCQVDPHADRRWFAASSERGGSPETNRARSEAVEACESCPVLEQCRTYALEAGEGAGVWGGLTPGDRARARRRGSVDVDAVA